MKKRRTRQHIVEDLGLNHLERAVLLAGFTVQRYEHDYGYDGIIQFFNEAGEYENQMVHFQLKSTDHPHFLPEKAAFAFDLSVKDLELWLFGSLPVLLILYDAEKHRAFFIDLQAYFRENGPALKNSNKFVRVHIPKKNRVNTRFISKLRQ